VILICKLSQQKHVTFDPTTLASYSVKSAIKALHHHKLHMEFHVYLSNTAQAVSERLHVPGRVMACSQLKPINTSCLKFRLNLESMHFCTLSQRYSGNNLPQNLRTITELFIFNKHFKSHLFTAAFNITWFSAYMTMFFESWTQHKCISKSTIQWNKPLIRLKQNCS
jgi:hypothetical protein